MKRYTKWRSGLFLLVLTCCVSLLGQVPVPRQAVVEVPFEFVHGAIIVRATVNGDGPFWVMLDTGADPSVVELETAKSLGLKIAASGQQGSGGGTSANLIYETSFPVLQLGGLTATNVDAVAMDLSKISSALGRPISGVLGYSLLKRRIVQINYPDRKLRFYTSAPPCAGAALSHHPKCTKLSFRYKDDILATGVSVDGKPVTANVDTGSNANFQLTPAAVEKLGLGGNMACAHASNSVGFNGNLKNREGTVGNVTVGSISVSGPKVVFLGKGMGMDKQSWDLRIGSAFLKDFVVTLDYRHGQITLAVPWS